MFPRLLSWLTFFFFFAVVAVWLVTIPLLGGLVNHVQQLLQKQVTQASRLYSNTICSHKLIESRILQMQHLHIHSMTSTLTRYTENMALRKQGLRLWTRRTCQRVEHLFDTFLDYTLVCITRSYPLWVPLIYELWRKRQCYTASKDSVVDQRQSWSMSVDPIDQLSTSGNRSWSISVNTVY